MIGASPQAQDRGEQGQVSSDRFGDGDQVRNEDAFRAVGKGRAEGDLPEVV
jgi:hypothetical protein